MNKRVVVIFFIAFIVLAGIARADLLEWKKMSFEVAKPLPALDAMADVRKVFASPLVCSACHQHHHQKWSNSFHAKSALCLRE